MQVFQTLLSQGQWSNTLPVNSRAQWVLMFGDAEYLSQPQIQQQLQQAFPHAEFTGCSTSGEFLDAELFDHSLSITAIEFNTSDVKVVSDNISQFDASAEIGKTLVSRLPTQGLRHVFILSDGQLINGSELVEACSECLPDKVAITGGLAGDGERFEVTSVAHNQVCASGLVVLVGLYGEQLQIGYGNQGGWKPFGADRIISSSKHNLLYEIDGKPALELYKSFLGAHASELPASALLFPLGIKQQADAAPVVRTIISIDEQMQSMTFAGNVPQGSSCQMMRANHENLVEGAHGAIRQALEYPQRIQPQLALLVSCVGRRLVLGQRAEEELEEIRQELDPGCAMTGFYSYGEISTCAESGKGSMLLNQTMTVTLIAERNDA